MAATLLMGNIVVGRAEQTFEGSQPHLDGTKKERGWDPIIDGGASVELVALLRGSLDVRLAARALALTILDASHDLHRRVPAVLMARIKELATDATPPPVTGRHSWVAPSVGRCSNDGEVSEDAELRDSDAERCRKRERTGAAKSKETSSSSSAETKSDGDVFSSDDDGFDIPPPVKKPAKVKWDKDAPLLSYGEMLDEPALGMSEGVTGEKRQLLMSLPFFPHLPGTSTSMLKVLKFVRAVTVDLVFVCASQGAWAAVDAVQAVLQAETFSIAALTAVLRLPVVKEQQLLHGAVACFGPGLTANSETRKLFAAVLAALKNLLVEYDKWVSDMVPEAAIDRVTAGALPLVMAAAHPVQTFSNNADTRGCLLPAATVAAYRSVYREYSDQ